ncbi:MAG: N-acetylmuramoyl-L-alanine amidase [Candidatus Andersenbacteria bacterium]
MSTPGRLRRWGLVFLTVALVGFAVVSAAPQLRRWLGVEQLVSSLGQSFATQSQVAQNVETLSSNPGLTLTQSQGGYADARHVESEIYTTKTIFTAVGVRWHAALPAQTSLTLAVRTGNGTDTSWQAWQPVHLSEDAFVADDPTARVSDLLFVPPGNRLQFSADLKTDRIDRTPRLEDIRFDFMNPDPGPDAPPPDLNGQEGQLNAQSATTNQPAIISRAQWGADESLMEWAPQYASVQQIVVHHTAGGNGGSDPAATIRGIYQYHAQTLGWGDIGYNFIIDPQGRIYEGRTGGWGVIGAHALGYNTGSIGIALLGTYENNPISSQTRQALVQLAAFISAKYDLDPTATHFFVNKNGPTLAGHRDFGQTLCPGTAQYGQLSGIRSEALTARASYYSSGNGGSLIEVTGAILPKNTAGKATVRIKNTGQSAWTNSGTTPVVLRTTSPANHASTLATTGWNSASEPTTLKESSVGPGQTGSFIVPLAAAGLGDTKDTFVVARRGSAVIPGTAFTLTRSVREAYQGKVIGLVDPIAVEGGKTAQITVRIRNTGATAWSASGATPAALNLTQPTGRTSVLRDASWPLSYRPTLLDSSAVAPDKEGVFTFSLQIPAKPAEYFEPMQAVVDGVGFIAGSEFTLHLVASNPYQAELQERPALVYVSPGETAQVKLSLTNYSTQTWRASGTGLVALELAGQANSILHAGSWVSTTRPMQLSQDVVSGSSTVLSFPIQAPANAGEYSETYHLVSGGTSIDGSTVTVRVAVRPAYAARLQTVDNKVSIPLGQTKRLSVELTNLGARSWSSGGPSKVQVVTDKSIKHASGFKSGSWTNEYTPTLLEPPLVGPDQRVRLSMEVAADSKNSETSEWFTLLDPTGAAITGSSFQIVRTTTGTPPQTSGGSNGPDVRIGIYSTSKKVGVSAQSSYQVTNTNKDKLGSVSSGRVDVTWDGSRYVLTGALTGQSTTPVRFVPNGQTILEFADYQDHPTWNPQLNDNAFRGVLEVRHATDGKVYGINELPLELYMRGLAEASNDLNATYLRVLAIAARTYAEYQRSIGGKHPAQGFDLDNKNDQQYKGYNLEKRNDKVVAAVNATRGTVVTYQDKVVVTPYFSQSDGHTRGFNEVFGGPVKPWLVSVSIPENQGKPLLGHGVGLDASAAQTRTAAGQSADTVLKYFYTGTALKQLY